MARKTFVELIDDLDGSKAEETVSFSLDGVAYEIDLSVENAERLRSEIGNWTAQDRRVAGRRIRGTGAATSTGGSNDSSKIRQWARENGREVSDRGRIPEELRQAYYAAN